MGASLAVFTIIALLLFAVKLIEHSLGRNIIPPVDTEHVSMWEAIQLKEDQRTGRNLDASYTYDEGDPGVPDDLRKIYNRSLNEKLYFLWG